MSGLTAEAAPTVSVVVIAWNSRDLLRTCLSKLMASDADPGFEVIIVDNASTDGTAEMVAETFPAVRVIRSDTNLGFAGGNNLGFRSARGEYVLLLNPDAFIERPDTLGRLAAFLAAHPEHAGVGCRLTYPDGRHQVGDAGYRPTPASVIVHGFALSRILPGLKGLFLTQGQTGAARDVDWISGALFMVRRRVIEEVGGLDTSFFMYAEDVEWGCRMGEAGWKIGYLPSVAVIHLQGGTQSGSHSTRWLDALAELYRRRNPGMFWVFRLGLGLGFGARAVALRAVSFTGHPGFRDRAQAMSVYARHILTAPTPGRN